MPSPNPLRRRLKAIAAVIVTAVMAVTCDLVTSPESGRTIRVEFQIPDSIIVVGSSIHVPVSVTEGGVPLEGVTFEVTSLEPSVVQVAAPSTPGGAVTFEGLRRGRARVRARLLGSAFADNPPTGDTAFVVFVKAVDIDQSNVVLLSFGDTLTLTARGVAAADTPVTDQVTVRWRSLAPLVATVDSISGRVRAVNNGAAVIEARIDNKLDTLTVRVAQALRRWGLSSPSLILNAINATTQFSVIPLDSAGAQVMAAGVPLPVFSTSNPAALQLTAGANSNTVVLTARANDTTTLRIVGPGSPADTTIEVRIAQVAGTVLVAGPRVDTIDALGRTRLKVATAVDSGGTTIVGQTIAWNSTRGTIANVDAGGIITAIDTGTALIYATLVPEADTITIVVRNVPRSIRTTPSVRNFTSLGETTTIVDSIFSSLPAYIAGVRARWSSLNVVIATVDSISGLVTAVSPGTTGIVGAIPGCTGLGCSDTTTVIVVNEAVNISIDTPSVTLASLGDAFSPPVTIANALGAPGLPRSSVSWSSGNPNVATVSNDGLIQAVGAGVTRVIATVPSGNDADTVAITVTNAPVSLTLTRTRDTLTAPTSTLQYQALVRNAAGALIPGAAVTFTSTRGSAASVSGTGLATQNAQTLDSTLIIAEVTGAAGTRADTAVLVVRNDVVLVVLDRAQVTIGAINDTAHFRATALNSANQSVPSLTFEWRSTNGAVATVSPTGSTSVVTAVGIGSATVFARIQTDTLKQSVPAAITVTNAPDTIRFDSAITDTVILHSINDPYTTTGVFRNRLGVNLSPSAAAWSSDGTGVASVDTDGRITALGRGTTKIRARSPLANSSAEDSLLVRVTNAPASINVLPNAAQTLASLGRTVTLTADVFNGRGVSIPGETVTWVSLNTNVATVTAGGVVTAATDTGSTFVQGSATGPLGTFTDQVQIIVLNRAAVVEFLPLAVSLSSVGGQQSVRARARNERGDTIANPFVTWTMANPAVARFRVAPATLSIGPVQTRDTVRVEAFGTGSTTLTATIDGIVNSIGVSVGNPPATVQITSGNLTLASVNDTVVPSVNFLNGLGAALPRNAVLWTTSNATVATVSSNGDVVATGAGTATITATSPVNSALTSSITVTVTNAPVSVTLNTTSNTLTALGRTLQYIATVRNARTDVITNPSVAWSSNNGAVASVDPATGLATANAVGGPVTITATASSTVGPLVQASTNASLNVTNFAVSLDLSPNVDTILNLTAPNTTQLTAVARNDLGGVLPAAAVTWSSVGAAATVSGTGLVTAATVGTAQIIASVATSATTTLAETTFVTVVNAPQTVAFTSVDTTLASLANTWTPGITIQNQGGTNLARTAVLWSSSATNVATVTNGGVVTAVGTGAATITATSPFDPAKTTSRVVTVTNAPVSVVLNQGNIALNGIGATTTYSAVVRNANNDPIPSATVTWDVTAGTSATIGTTTGIVTAVSTGLTTIRARVVGALTVAATADVTVTNGAASISVSPASVALNAVGAQQVLTATVRNSLGNPIAGAAVTFSSSAGAVVDAGTTFADGNNVATIQGAAVGAATITADAGGGVTTTVPVTVTNFPATIAITDGTPTAPDTLASINDTLVLTVTVDNSQSVALGAAAATWTSSNTGVATAAPGRAIAVGVGTAVIRAESPGNPAVFDTITVIVTNAPDGVAIDQAGPDTMTALGQQIVYTATVRNGRNAIIPGAAVAWNSSATGIATINPTDGTATPAGFSASATSITAMSGTITSAALLLFVVNPDTLRVNKDATGAYQFGTGEFPYRTIQAAVAAADPNDVVLIRKATTSYNETLTLSTAVTLSGANAAGVVCGPATCPDSTTVPVIAHAFGAAAISATGVPLRLRHLAVAHSTDGPAVDANGASLRADTIYVNPGATTQAGRGILVRNARGNRIVGARVNRVGGYGIRFENADSSFVIGATVTNVDTVAGVNSRAGLYATGGDSVFVTTSSFTAAATVADGIRLNDVDSVVTSGNTLSSVRYGLRADADVHLVSSNDVFGAATHSCLHVTGSNQVASVTGATVTGCASAHADSGAVTVNGASARLFVGTSSFTGMDRRIVHFLNGRTMWVSQSTMVGTGAAPATAGDTTGGAAVIQTVAADSAVIDSSTVREFRRLRALTLVATLLVRVDSNLITRNRLGMRFNNLPTTFAVADNDVFDHQDTVSARLATFDLRSQGALAGNWWGDVNRGPAESTFPAGVASLGDSVDVVGFVPDYTAARRDTPFRPQASTAAATTIRHLRGHRLTFPTGGSDTVAVRVLDATGRPVQGYDVQFDDASNDVKFTGNVSTITRTTDAAGIARVEVINITGAAGNRTVTVSPVTTGTPAPINFIVTK